MSENPPPASAVGEEGVGGGMRTGQVIGATNAKGEPCDPLEHYTPTALCAALQGALFEQEAEFRAQGLFPSQLCGRDLVWGRLGPHLVQRS